MGEELVKEVAVIMSAEDIDKEEHKHVVLNCRLVITAGYELEGEGSILNAGKTSKKELPAKKKMMVNDDSDAEVDEE